jgi:hypothetical protein
VVAMPRLWAGRRRDLMSRRVTGQRFQFEANDRPNVLADGQQQGKVADWTV